MKGRSFPKYKKYRALFVLLFLLTASLGVVLYETVTFGLGRVPDLMPYAEEICGQNAHAVERYDMTGLSIVGVVDENEQYNLVGFVKSPVSGRYREEYVTYKDNESPEKVLHGVMCIFKRDGFSYTFNLCEMSDENVSEFASSSIWYPVTMKQNILSPAKSLIERAALSVFALTLVPYIIICGGLMLVWVLAFLVVTQRELRRKRYMELET